MEIELQPGETVEHSYRKTPWVLLWAVLLSLLYLALAGAVTYVSTITTSSEARNSFGLLALVLVGFAVFTLVIAVFKYRRTVFFITNRRLISNQQLSILGSQQDTVFLSIVTNADGQMSGLGAVLDYGSVKVQTVGGVKDFIMFGPLPDPKGVENAIMAVAQPIASRL